MHPGSTVRQFKAGNNRWQSFEYETCSNPNRPPTGTQNSFEYETEYNIGKVRQGLVPTLPTVRSVVTETSYLPQSGCPEAFFVSRKSFEYETGSKRNCQM